MEAKFIFDPGIGTPENDEQFEQKWKRFTEEAQVDEPIELESKQALRTHIAEQYGHALSLMDLFWRTAIETINWGSKTLHEHLDESSDDDAYATFFTTLTGLTARALLAFNEVTWLLRGGYSQGAFTRVRSLHEFFVVTTVLQKYGSPDSDHPDLLERYLVHNEVFMKGTATNLIDTEVPGIEDTLNSEVLNALDSRRKELIEKYGKTFSGSYGWASPLFKGNPSFTGLNDLVMPNLKAYYQIASEHLHASSAGLLDTSAPNEMGEIRYNAGPSTEELEVPAILATSFMLALVNNTVPTEIHFPNTEKNIDTGHHMLEILARLFSEILDAWNRESAEDCSKVVVSESS